MRRFDISCNPDRREVGYGHGRFRFLAEIGPDDQVVANDTTRNGRNDAQRFAHLHGSGIHVEEGQAAPCKLAGIFRIPNFCTDLLPFPVGEHARLMQGFFSPLVGCRKVGCATAFLIGFYRFHIIRRTDFEQSLSAPDRIAQPDKSPNHPTAKRQADFSDTARPRPDRSHRLELDVNCLWL